MEWREKGNCWGKTKNSKTDYWFPEDDDPDKQNKIKIAKNLCNDCAVKIECLEFALGNEEEYGIWGGMTPRERRAHLRKNRIYWNAGDKEVR